MRRPVIIVAIAGTFVVALLASVLTTPWWTGGAIAAIGSRFGLTFASYEAEGYRTFTLRDVRYERRGVRVTVDHVQSAGVLRWGWRRLTGKPTEVVAGRWSVEVQPTPNAPRTQTPRGWVPLRAQLVRTADLLERWLPAAKVGEGVVSWPKGQLALSSAEWKGRVLRSPEVSFRSFKAAVDVSLPASGALAANVSAANGEGSLALHSVGADLSGAVEWWEQNAKLAVHFAETGWMPREAELDAPQWEIPARRVKLGGQYAVLRGRGEVVWREGKLTADIGVEGVPLPEAKAPPLTVVVRGRGEDGAFRAEQLQIDLPGIVARLSDPLAIDRRGRVRSGPAGFTLRAELGRLPWLAARGVVEGTGTIAAGADDMARVEFALGADEIDVAGVALKRLESGGLLEWPRLTLNKGRLVSPGGEELAFKGGWDFRAREVIAAEVQGRVGADLIGRRMPAGIALDAVTVELKAQGPLAALTHEGRVDASNVRMPKLRPMTIRADWRGRWDQLEHFSAAVAAGASRLTAAGSASRSAVELQQFALERNDAALLRLAQPASVRWAPSLQVEGVRLDGAEAHLHAALQWAKAGHIDVSARGVRPEWFSDFVQLPQSMWTVDTVAVKGTWNDSPAEYEASATGWINVGDDKTARLSAQVKGSAGGVEVTTFDVSEGGGAIAHATGHLPFVIRPAGKPFFQLDEDATLSLDATTSPNPEFWRNITELTGVELIEPSVDVHLSGSWRNPRGDARLSARSLAAVSGRFQGKWPKIDALHAHLVGLNDGVRLEAFTLNVEGQAVRAEGWLPLSLERWREIREDPRNLARSGDLRLQVPDADLAALAQYFPSILAPRGRLQLDVTLKSDATLTGFLQVRNATSRPLGPLGVLQEITADAKFNGRMLELEGVTARMGGQLVSLQGRAELPVSGPPRMDFRLNGDNLPFVRRAGLLVRGDLDLTLLTSPTGRTTIGGKVNLRDSLFLADLRSFIPSGAKGSAARPPYFSIDAKPLDGWRLDVSVQGEEFLRLRTPVFNGTASARFQLDGTLGEPRARGEAVITQGNVRLPFANFTVRQGYVRISPEEAEPQLFVSGQMRRYGYDVRMELTGPVSAPHLNLSSSPPLEAEQVLLMVMAGQAPNDEITTTDRQRMARFGAFFGQSLLGTLGGDAGGADRLTISSGENISEQGRETYSIEYRLSDRWAVTGEYDEFDDYYGGLKWRIYSKGGREDASE